MNIEKIRLIVEIFFEIKDSEMFGGIGSVGYTCIKATGGYSMISKDIEKYISTQIKYLSAGMNVSEDCIRVITAEEYELNTEDEE